MKLQIGVDSQSGLEHSAVTPANVHDKHPPPDLLLGLERRVYGDSSYASQKELIQGRAPPGSDTDAHHCTCKVPCAIFVHCSINAAMASRSRWSRRTA